MPTVAINDMGRIDRAALKSSWTATGPTWSRSNGPDPGMPALPRGALRGSWWRREAEEATGAMKDLLRLADLSPADLELLLNEAASAAADPNRDRNALGDTVALYFANPPVSVRLALQTAVTRLGGMPLAVVPGELERSCGETIQDTARAISHYVRAIVVHAASDRDLRQVAAASVPVVNAASHGHDLCQALAGLFTLQQRWGRLAGRKLAYVANGGNVTHSLLEAGPNPGPPVPDDTAPLVAAIRVAARGDGR